LWGGFSVRDAYFDLPQHRHDLLWFVPLDRHGQLFLQVDSLSFHLVQISTVTSDTLDNYIVTRYYCLFLQMLLLTGNRCCCGVGAA